ncbi:MAG TPA: LysR family transcriptional regulator [Polyangiaceae bacterium]|nr:LysR family transcriptional regulator [Polyangiaceae bacterium]
MSDPDWNDFRILTALERGGSVAAAARLLGVDTSTVSRRLAALEEALGAQLLCRGGREFSWTAAGTAAVSVATQIAERVDEVTRTIRAARDDVEGLVRISCPTGLVLICSPIAATATQRYPGLTLEVSGRLGAADLAKGEADIALRAFKPNDADLVLRKAVEIGWVLVASQSYLEKHGRPKAESELAQHALVLFDASMQNVAGPKWLEARRGPNQRVTRLDSTDSAGYAIAAGAGIGVLPMPALHDRPQLVRLFEQPVAMATLWIVYHRANRNSARVRAVVELLVEFFEQNAQRFSGVATKV